MRQYIGSAQRHGETKPPPCLRVAVNGTFVGTSLRAMTIWPTFSSSKHRNTHRARASHGRTGLVAWPSSPRPTATSRRPRGRGGSWWDHRAGGRDRERRPPPRATARRAGGGWSSRAKAGSGTGRRQSSTAHPASVDHIPANDDRKSAIVLASGVLAAVLTKVVGVIWKGWDGLPG